MNDGPKSNDDPQLIDADEQSIRVLIADDQEIIRAGLKTILDGHSDIAVVGVAKDGVEAIEMARRLRPDVCLFDIRMPNLNGLEATEALAGPGVENPLAVVLITTFDSDEYIYGALKAGAKGFLLKDAGPALLTQAVRAAAQGDALIAPSVTARLLSSFAASHFENSQSQADEPVVPLTSREEEILVAVAKGRTNPEIADEFYVSLSTVKTHLASLLSKLGARNRVELAMWAHESGRV